MGKTWKDSQSFKNSRDTWESKREKNLKKGKKNKQKPLEK